MNLWKKIGIIGSLIIIILSIVLLPTLLQIYFKNALLTILVTFLTCYMINVVFGLYIFYSPKRNNISKKCLLLSFLLLPAIAPFFFLWFGFNPYSKEIIYSIRENLKKYFYVKKEKSNCKISDPYELIENYDNYHNQPISAGCNIKFLPDVEKSYKETLKLIRTAKKIIFIEYYIISDGIWFRSILNELIKANNKGVQIYFLYDWIGSRKKKAIKKIKSLASDTFCVKTFKPKSNFLISSSDNSRCHKKMIIVDNKKMFYGGANISDEYINFSEKYEYWNDNNFIIEGDLVNNFSKSFIFEWNFFTNNTKNEFIDNYTNKKNYSNKYNGKGIVINSFPELKESHAVSYISMILQKAIKKIWICTPYLYPTNYLINLLSSYSQAGLDVKIFTPRLNDNKKFITNLNRSQYKKIISSGIEIYEVDAFLHSKTIIVDDDISLIGTFNFDPRALWINYESLCLIKSKELNTELTDFLIKSKNYSKIITSDKIKKESLFSKIVIKILLLFEPIL